MKFQQLLPVLPLASAIVITETSIFEKLQKSGKQLIDNTQNVLDDALGRTQQTFKQAEDEAYNKIHQVGCDVDSWLKSSSPSRTPLSDLEEDHEHPPHHGPHHGDPHHDPHPPNQTVYELISKSKYTTKLTELINKFPDVVEALNGTKANYTIFAPTDKAFEKIPHHHGHNVSDEILKKVLLYHVSDHFYPAGRVLHTYTIPTLLQPEHLGNKQRLTVRVTLKGPTINFYSRLVAVDIFGTNGVIHGVDSILVPPPSVASIIDLLPGDFSTLELALEKTGLYEKMNATEYPHQGGTLFAPSNFAFKKLGPRLNAFLFSKYGQKYLKAILEYHIVVNKTLYSDAYFESDDDESKATVHPPTYHLDLPTVLGKPLGVDFARYGPFVEIRINAFSRVTVHDGVANDGVIQVISNVLIPPKKVGDEEVYWKGEEMSVEELKERLEPFVSEADDNLEL